MNKIIKELVGDATLYADSHWDRGCAPWHQFYNEKFAELIIKETMQIVVNQLPSNQYLDVAHAVIEHFGVKE